MDSDALRYSSRLPWNAATNALTRTLAEFPARLDLTESNPTRAGIPYRSEAILDGLRDGRSLEYEPSARGLATAREAVSRYYGGAIGPERVMLTASTSEAYSFLFKLLCDPGDEVLVPRPSYPLFEHLASLEAVAVRQYPLHYQEGWWIDLAAVRAMATPRTRAVVVVSPNNPTGSYLKRAELDGLASLGLPIIADEVFADYGLTEDPSRVTLAAAASRVHVPVFSLNGFSKLLGLPQMKLGWIATNHADSLARLELVADTYLSVSAPVQHAAARWLDELREPFHAAMIERLSGNLAWLTRAGAEALHAEGGWYAILRLPRTRTDEEWAIELLRRDGVLVQPGYFYDFESEAFAVVSLLTRPDVFREGISLVLERTHVASES